MKKIMYTNRVEIDVIRYLFDPIYYIKKTIEIFSKRA